MKRIKFKEFKEALTMAYGEVDYGSILNKLALLHDYEAKMFTQHGCNSAAKHEQQLGDTLYYYLYRKGYYKE